MKIKILIILSFSLFFTLVALPGRFVNVISQNTNSNQTADCCPIPCASPAPTFPFRSYSADFPFDEEFCKSGKKPFELSQDYPKTKPTPENFPWRKYVNKIGDFEKNWREYLQAVLVYGYEGNIEADWVVQNNTKKREWFHAPFMDVIGVGLDRQGNIRASGREYLRGLTQERRTCLEEMKGERSCQSSSPRIQNWAVSVYNKPGGYFISQVWRELFQNLDTTKPVKNPNPKNIWMKNKEGFPEGTVVIKLLFTESNDDMFAGSIVWEANINVPDTNPIKRQTKKMRLAQIDVAVRDDISPTDWVYGTFVFQRGSATPISYPKTLDEKNKAWLKFIPIGLMYGSGEDEFFNEVKENLPYNQHQGCNTYLTDTGSFREGKPRTNGPIDNPNSSCIACHAAAETGSLDKFDFTNLDDEYQNPCSDRKSHAFWFRNVNPRNKTDNRTLQDEAVSLDFSLQLRAGIERCCRDGNEGKTPGCLCGKSDNNKKKGEPMR